MNLVNLCQFLNTITITGPLSRGLQQKEKYCNVCVTHLPFQVTWWEYITDIRLPPVLRLHLCMQDIVHCIIPHTPLDLFYMTWVFPFLLHSCYSVSQLKVLNNTQDALPFLHSTHASTSIIGPGPERRRRPQPQTQTVWWLRQCSRLYLPRWWDVWQ